MRKRVRRMPQGLVLLGGIAVLLLGGPPVGVAEADLSSLAEERFEKFAQLLDEELPGGADQLKAFLEEARTAFLNGSASEVQKNMNILMTATFSLTELGRDLGIVGTLGAERLRLGLTLLEDAILLVLPEAGPLQLGLYVAKTDGEERERAVGPFLKECPPQLTLRGPQGELTFEQRSCISIMPEASRSP